MIKGAKALSRFDGFRMLTENIPIGFFRLHEAAENFQAGRVMAADLWVDLAAGARRFVGERRFNEG